VVQVDMLRLDRGSIQDSALCGSYSLYLVQWHLQCTSTTARKCNV